MILRKRSDFRPWHGHGSQVVEFDALHPRVQLPDKEPRRCASCGSDTWQLGPNHEMVCNNCHSMYWRVWQKAQVSHV